MSRGTNFDGDCLSRGTKLVGDHLSMGTKFLGTICPWGQEVGDRKSGDQMGSGPNESQPYMLLLGKSQFSNFCRQKTYRMSEESKKNLVKLNLNSSSELHNGF